MAKFRIAVIGGDGIGPEVTEQAVRAADAAVKADGAALAWTRLPWGSAFYQETGRMIRAAFEYARKRPRKKLTSITKSNALTYSMVLWDEAFAAVRAEFPDVQANYLLVDAAAMDFVRRPETFDVVVASNLFGDILTDLSAIVSVGSLGLASSANINPERTYPSLFEPVHGSAPDITGKGIANPLAAILSAALLLDHLGTPPAAAAIRRAVAAVLKAGKTRTPDLGGQATTVEMAETVLAAL